MLSQDRFASGRSLCLITLIEFPIKVMQKFNERFCVLSNIIKPFMQNTEKCSNLL